MKPTLLHALSLSLSGYSTRACSIDFAEHKQISFTEIKLLSIFLSLPLLLLLLFVFSKILTRRISETTTTTTTTATATISYSIGLCGSYVCRESVMPPQSQWDGEWRSIVCQLCVPDYSRMNQSVHWQDQLKNRLNWSKFIPVALELSTVFTVCAKSVTGTCWAEGFGRIMSTCDLCQWICNFHFKIKIQIRVHIPKKLNIWEKTEILSIQSYFCWIKARERRCLQEKKKPS